MLAAAALAAGLTIAGTGTANAVPVPPTSAWAEIFNPNVNANGITLCVDNGGSNSEFTALQLWRCHGYASNGLPQRWVFTNVGSDLFGNPVYQIRGGAGYCIGLSSDTSWNDLGTSLVQETCADTLRTDWQVVTLDTTEPDSQFGLANTWHGFSQVPWCMSASSWADTNGTRLIARQCSGDTRNLWSLG